MNVLSIYMGFLCFCLSLWNPDDGNGNKMDKEKRRMTQRTIKKLHTAEFSKIGDLITYRAMPTQSLGMENIEPFIFLNHHGPQTYKPNNHGLPFGPHPHKGFETLTFILKGDILHKDTEGHESVIQEGGIQWMTAGSGLIHSEVSSEEFKAKGGDIEILQLWINLPAKFKQTAPKYIGLQETQIPHLSADSGRVQINLISGNWEDTHAPIQSLSDVHTTSISFKSGGKLSTHVDTARVVFLYVVKGELTINGKIVSMHHMVEFNNDGDALEMEALKDAAILFGHAQANKEPIVARGPFVMNTLEEIKQAYKDYDEGKFGEME